MKHILHMMAVALVAGVAWHVVWAPVSDGTAKRQAEVRALHQFGRRQPGDKQARIELNRSIPDRGEQRLKKTEEGEDVSRTE